MKDENQDEGPQIINFDSRLALKEIEAVLEQMTPEELAQVPDLVRKEEARQARKAKKKAASATQHAIDQQAHLAIGWHPAGARDSRPAANETCGDSRPGRTLQTGPANGTWTVSMRTRMTGRLTPRGASRLAVFVARTWALTGTSADGLKSQSRLSSSSNDLSDLSASRMAACPAAVLRSSAAVLRASSLPRRSIAATNFDSFDVDMTPSVERTNRRPGAIAARPAPPHKPRETAGERAF